MPPREPKPPKPKPTKPQAPKPEPFDPSWSFLLSAFGRKFAKSLSRILGATVGLTTHLSLAWQILGGLSILVGLAAGLVFFLPRISVEPGPQRDSTDPFSSAFLVANTGAIRLEGVSIEFALCRLRANVGFEIRGPNWEDCNRHNEVSERLPKYQNQSLPMDQKMTVLFSDILAPKVGSIVKPVYIDADIIVSSRPAYFPWRWREEFRFEGVVRPDGGLHWQPRQHSD